jgi:methylenetetrahydrofolate reductase (NADH)
MRDDRWVLACLLTIVRCEIIPTPTIADRVREVVPTDVTVTVTASPAKGLEPTLGLAEQLTGAGYRVVPHIAAGWSRTRCTSRPQSTASSARASRT